MIATFVGFITFKSDVVSAAIIYVGSGPGNHTASIQDAIDNYANDGDNVFVYSGTYLENIVVNKTINLIGESRDTTIIDGGGFGSVVSIVADWVNVSGFTITFGEFGISLQSNSTTISDNKIVLNAGNGVYLQSTFNNNIIGNNITSNDGYGIDLASSICINIQGNIMIWDGIYIQGNQIEHWNTHNIDTSNTVKGKPVYYWKNRTAGIVPSGAGEVILANCTNVRIENQELTNSSVGIELGFSSNNFIINNNVSSNNWYGMYLYTSNGNNITGNTLSNNNEGISIDFSSGNIIKGNLISYNDLYGVCLSLSNYNSLTNNYVSDNENGIVLHGSTYNIIKVNNVSSNQEEGIWIAGLSHYNNIIKNDIFSNGCGIYLSTSGHNSVKDNNINSNIGNGISFGLADFNEITSNTISNNSCGIQGGMNLNQITKNNISNNDYGIYLDSSFYNNIYHNNIIENKIQAYDNRKDNYWDNGYPSGGNYWSDFDDPSEGAYDDYKGPNQDDPTSGDGIVDNGTGAGGGKNPYVIDGDSQDNYPLIKFVEHLFLYEGWNLISIPFIQPDTNLGTVLNPIKGSYDAVQWYNVSDNSDPWKHSSIKKPSNLNDLNNINHTMGFWIHITKPGWVLFQYSGIQPTDNQSITLYPGWNLVGYPSLTNYNRTQGLNNITFNSEVDSIWTYNAATLRWEEIGETDYFERGRGYWIHSLVKKTWDVPL